jgi:hypothetical protein
VLIQVVFDIVVVIGLTWFWARYARRALITLGAEPLALRLGLGATLVAIAATMLHAIATLTATGVDAAAWIRIAGGFAWIVVVGLGYPRYGFLRHLTGTPGRET